jgi:hypothetical protein
MTKTEELTVNDTDRPTTEASNTLTPVSDDPSFRGLYVVTTYDDFFRQDRNGNGAKNGDKVESHS